MTQTTLAKPEPSPIYRWLVLIFVSLPMFGNYYIYDSLAPIADLLKSQLHITDSDYGSLQSIYGIAAAAVLLIGGIIVDKFGTKITILIFASLCSISAFLMIVSSDYNVMLSGRLLLGIGAEIMIVAITTALAKWFKGKELGLALGINISIARLGSAAADLSPAWASSYYDTYSGPLMIAFFIGLTCVVGGIIYAFMEGYASKRYKLGAAGETDKFVWGDLFKFNKSFWYITLLCVTFYSAIFPFRSFAIKYFIEGHGVERDIAGMFNSALPWASMIATPIFGILADKYGKRAFMMMIGSLLILPVYLMMAYSGITLYIPVIMMGIAFSLIPAVMWPSVAYLVEEKRLGTAYALMSLIQQLGVSAFNEIIGYANDYSAASAQNPEGYALGMWIFSILGVLGLVFAYLLRKSETGPNSHGLEEGMASK